MDSSVVLNRLLITGPLDDNVPLVVLLEIVEAHGLEYDPDYLEDADFIHDVVHDVSVHQVPFSLGKLARYINHQIRWSQEQLLQYYHQMHSFVSNHDLLQPLQPGQIEPGKFMMNACMAYGLCQKYKIRTNNATTLDQMSAAINLIAQPAEVLQFRALSLMRVCPVDVLVNFLQSHEVPPSSRSQDLTAAVAKLTDPNLTRLCYVPESDEEAIVATAINMKVDISRAQHPLLEYGRIRLALKQPYPQIVYQPYDQWMNHWYTRNPLFFSVKWGQNSNLNFVKTVQDEIPTLLPGPSPDHPHTSAGESKIDMVDLSQISVGGLYLYQGQKELEPYTLEELIDSFSHSRSFVLPTKDPFLLPLNQGMKFRELLIDVYPFANHNTRTVIDRAVQVVDDIASFLAASDETTKAFNQIYSVSPPSQRAAYLDCLVKVLHAGMYMRNWKGPGNAYPLTDIDSLTPAKDEADLALRVTEALTGILSLPTEVRATVLSLPLVKPVNGGYVDSTEKINGLTIKDRLDIVYEGESSGNMSACIRESSNYLCASAHKYLGAIGQPLPFVLDQLRLIH